MGDLDVRRTGPSLARELTAEWVVGSLSGALCIVGVGILGGVAINLLVKTKWSLWQRVVASLVVAIGVMIVWIVLVFLFKLASAVKRQRDDARTRLVQIQDVTRSYNLVPGETRSAPNGTSQLLWQPLHNSGRGARFAAVILALDGAVEPLLEPHSYLHWVGRPGISVEEIPRDEGRLVCVGQIDRVKDLPYDLNKDADPTYVSTKSVSFRRVDLDGQPIGRTYPLSAGVPLVAKFRVSARDLPEISYSRTLAVEIRWPGGDAEVQLRLSDPGVAEQSSAPPLADLLDF